MHNHVPKVISPKGKWLVVKVVLAERGQTVTVVCCMSPTGNFVPPAIIFSELGSSVSIVSGYRLDDQAIEVRSPAEAKGFFL
jgi:hypothetical protein